MWVDKQSKKYRLRFAFVHLTITIKLRKYVALCDARRNWKQAGRGLRIALTVRGKDVLYANVLE
jgi:hypothetical protein